MPNRNSPRMTASKSNPFTGAQNKGMKLPNKTGMNNAKSMKGYNKNSKTVGGINGSGSSAPIK